MFPKMDSTNQARLPAVARAHCDVFQAGLPWQGMAKLYKGSIFCHHGDTICHPKSGYVTTKLHGTSTCGCNNNAMFSGRAITGSYVWLRLGKGATDRQFLLRSPAAVAYRDRSQRVVALSRTMGEYL